MLPPIPARILRSTATVKACTGTDIYQNQTYATYTVSRVHLQSTTEIRKTATNTDQQLRSILFVDARRSSPSLDWEGLLRSAHEKGGDVRVIVRGVEYTVLTADALRESSDRLHHWEIALY